MAATAVPLLEEERVRDGDDNEGEKWWKKVWDKDEAQKQAFFSLPMILTNLFYYLITLVSVMFAGHLGQLELAGATLSNSWAIVSGITFMIGLSGALETLCGQGFGAKLYKTLGIHLQAACITSFLFSIIVCFVWFFTEPILIFVRQDPQIAKTAAIYVKFLIPALFAYGFLQNILRSSTCSLNFIVGVLSCSRHLRDLLEEVRTDMAWIFSLILLLHLHKLETCCSLCSYGVYKSRNLWSFFALDSDLLFVWQLNLFSLDVSPMISVNTETIAYMVSCGLSSAARLIVHKLTILPGSSLVW
ncbi:hypothetical protein TIFTF001_023619 [Ficus carica]|uniref:Uncharacterized protein n=1 Tax=Ficus carica TaxID=3494 RepID=A0AA88AJY6_FICCA|nr:hypothetical protein TIFTF001_023619 [Ficus carica]